MKRERSGFLLPGVLLTALACIGVVMLIASAMGVLPEELPTLRTAGSSPRRNASIPVPAPTTRPPSPTPSATPSPTSSPSASRSGGASASASASASSTRRPVTVTPTATRSTTPPPPPPPPAPSCKAGSATVTAVADTYVDQASPTRNFGSSDTLQVTSRDRSRNRRSLVRFGAFVVPKGCTVRGGTLTMTARDASGRKLLVARATKAWGESAVTWANAPAPTGTAAGATVTGPRVAWSLPASTVTAAYGFVIYDSAENARGDGDQTNLAARSSRGAPTLTVRWS